jgi:3'-5' exonuclease
MNVFVFDIETVPDTDNGARLYDLSDLSPEQTADAMSHLKSRQGSNGFLPHYLHKIVAISAVMSHGQHLAVWSLGDEDSDEKELIERFYAGVAKYSPTLVSWNGAGFDLPVLHYRTLLHGVNASRYWESGETDNSFRYNNYLNRYHARHLDLMDVLSAYQMRACAPLDEIASLLGFPGKMGMNGGQVFDYYQAGKLSDIRDYCETDVLNTYLVYLRFELMRGALSDDDYQFECDRVKSLLIESDKDHLQTFLNVWQQHAK